MAGAPVHPHGLHGHHHLPPSSTPRIKYLIMGLIIGMVVGMQIMLIQVNSKADFVGAAAAGGDHLASVASTALFGEGPGPGMERRVQAAVEAAVQEQQQRQRALGSAPLLPAGLFPASLPAGAMEMDLRTPDQPWPMPLTPKELARWLDVLGKYTEAAPAVKATLPEDIDRRGVENPLGALPAASTGPVNIKKWVEEGKCKHADKYLGQILERLRPWTTGGISKGMIEEAARVGRERSSFAGLHYQIIDGHVYGRAEGNELYIERYAGLFANTLRHIKMPNMELALHNGLDLPVMLKHEVHPMFAYASADAFTEMLVPCTWYVLPLAASVAANHDTWAPLSLEEFKARAGKIFWRGSPNDFLHYTKENFKFAPRVKLVEQGMAHPDLLDVQLTSSLMLLGGNGWEAECAVYDFLKLERPEGVTGPCDASTVTAYRKAQEAKSAPIDNQDNGYRYSLNLDGTGVSERLSQQLSSSQLVFKADSPFYNYYSRFFLPWVHYVPVKYDLSDLAEKVAWANEHVEEAHAIMVRASTLAHELFHPDEVTCYTGLALSAYGRLLGFEPELREDMALFE